MGHPRDPGAVDLGRNPDWSKANAGVSVRLGCASLRTSSRLRCYAASLGMTAVED